MNHECNCGADGDVADGIMAEDTNVGRLGPLVLVATVVMSLISLLSPYGILHVMHSLLTLR